MKTEHALSEQSEFSYEIVADELPREGRHFVLTPEAHVRDALATRFELSDLSQFAAKVHAKPLAGGPIIRVTGTIDAVCVQPCIVSLEPVEQTVHETFEVEFSSSADLPQELELSEEDADPADPIVDGKIDLGELICQQLGVAIDPYPRAANADLDDMREAAAEKGRDFEVNAGKNNPFSVLASLKDGKKDNNR